MTTAETTSPQRWFLEFFFDFGGFAHAAAQIVQLAAAHRASADDFDACDVGAVNREHTLDPDAVGDAANRECLGNAAVFTGDHRAFEGLDSLALALFDLDSHLYGVADRKLGRLGLEAGIGHCFNQIHDNFLPSVFTGIRGRYADYAFARGIPASMFLAPTPGRNRRKQMLR